MEELETLPIAEETYPYILEFIKENKSVYLEELEEKAYEAVSKQN